MLEVIFIYYKPLLKILLYAFIILIIGLTIFWKKIKEYVNNNWIELRHQPWILPFAGLFKEQEGKGFKDIMMESFIGVIKLIVRPIFRILMIPVYAISKLLIALIKNTTSILQFFRKQITIIRNFMLKLFEQMYIRIQNSVGAVMFFVLKLRESMKRSFGAFSLVLNTIEHSQIFFESLVKGPVGRFASIVDWLGIASARFTLGPFGPATWRNALSVPTGDLMCFSPSTKIEIKNGNYIFINDIEIGDILSDNSSVIAKLNINYSGKIYKLGNIEVTGEHYVKENKSWIKVKNHKAAQEKCFEKNNLICLVTSSGLIHIDNFIFKDYIDNHDIHVNDIIIKKINEHLNEGRSQISKCNNLLSGFVRNNSLVIPYDREGTIEIGPGNLDLYEINGVILSGNILIKHENNWLRAAIYPDAKYIGKNVVKCYHYVTKSQIIKINENTVIRDFNETKDPILNREISEIIDKSIN